MKAQTVCRSTTHRPDSAVRAWLRLVRVYQKIQQASTDEFRAAGLSVGQFDMLAQIGAAEGSSQQQIADALLVTKSNVTQLLDRMERAGLVERQQHGRINHLYLTTEGRRLHDQLVPAHERHIAELLASLTPEDVAMLGTTLRKLDHALH
jgi:DNA-binding MarR family transcriptional regulator